MRRLAVLLFMLPAPAAAVELDDAAWATLSGLAESGFALPDISDRVRFRRAEYWTIADSAGGDCEDKALRARAILLAKGWPPHALRIAMAWTEAGDYHAVLTIDVERRGRPATYVVDGRFPWVVSWNALSQRGYRWDRRQAAGGAGWIRIAGGG